MAIGAVLLIVVVAAIGNHFRVEVEPVTIDLPDATLDGLLASPPEGDVEGLVVMVHGDGPVDADHAGFYLPWFEAAADAGYATLSWAKPGVAGSSGNWLNQSMGDRASEVSEVIDWAEGNLDVPTGQVVLWGASQAGWVMPTVVSDRRDVEALVAVGTAINWRRQGRFNLLAELEHEGAGESEVQEATEQSDLLRALMDRDAGYDEYLAETTEADPMSAQRWDFAKLNSGSDATADLVALATEEIPVLLLVGRHDRNVDVEETEAVYLDALGDNLQVEHVDSAHSMARPVMEDNPLVGTAAAVLWPRWLFADGVLEEYREFLEGLG